MPITPFLQDVECDAETKRIMGIAFEMARVSLGISGPSDRANENIARRIIELAKTGERNPDLLCEGVLKELRGQSVPGPGFAPPPPGRDTSAS
jgi:hypothetical protein